MLKPISILFLPGTDLSDLFYAPLLSALNTHGRVHRWRYRHHESMMAACKRHNGSANLYEDLRLEVCFGKSIEQPSLLGLEFTDSINYWYESLRGVMTPLDHWKRTIVVGHSQGAGHALFISQKRPVAGVVMIAGPADTTKGKLAPWSSQPSLTPTSRQLLMVHAQDGGCRAVLAHANACGLELKMLKNKLPPKVGGLALLDTKAVPPLSAHGCLAGADRWSTGIANNEGLQEILKRHIHQWRKP